MPTTTHSATCKFCRLPITLEVYDDCHAIEIERWKPVAACNRCADFRMGLLKLGDYCCAVIGEYLNAQGTKKANSAESEARDKLVEASKRLMRLCCEHYRVTNHWDSSLVDEMISNPGKIRFIIQFMRNQVEKSRQQQIEQKREALGA